MLSKDEIVFLLSYCGGKGQYDVTNKYVGSCRTQSIKDITQLMQNGRYTRRGGGRERWCGDACVALGGVSK